MKFDPKKNQKKVWGGRGLHIIIKNEVSLNNGCSKVLNICISTDCRVIPVVVKTLLILY